MAIPTVTTAARLICTRSVQVNVDVICQMSIPMVMTYMPDCFDACPHDPLKTHPGKCGCKFVEKSDCEAVITLCAAISSGDGTMDGVPVDEGIGILNRM